MTSSTTIHISVVVIPSNETKLLESHQLSWDLNSSSDDNNNNEGNSFRSNICSLLQDTDYLETPLLRPRGDDENQNFVATAGLYAYYNNAGQSQNNIRATRLAMACGLLAKRFQGDVLLIRSFGYGTFEDLSVKEVLGACELSPDLRISTQQEMKIMMQTVNHHDDDDDDHDNDDDATCTISSPPPAWLLDAAQQNYHDGAAMAKVVSAFKTNDNDDDDDSSSDNDSSDNNDVDSHNKVECKATSTTTTVKASYSNEFIAKSPLCLHCRGPTDNLCGGCEGAYFCCSLSQENDSRLQSILCRDVRGWSHLCQCPTWRLYTNHRKQLSTFPYLGDWHKRLMTRDYQTQQHPYEQFLQQSLGVTYDSSSWWVTEMGGGWSGGHGDSAKIVDATIRLSYSEGFAPVQDIPSEERVDSELRSSGLDLSRNLVGLLSFKSWEDYYKLRGISSESPIALLCTFPLTVYHALERYGSVPITVAKMLKRPLRIHLVGVEKELNFLDLFKEIGFLLPEDIQVELVFIVRPDMLPPKCREAPQQENGENGKFSLKIDMTTNLTVGVVSGTYGAAPPDKAKSLAKRQCASSSLSLDPNFDCGTGPPDMIIALNAGLFAYESWRSVISYLYHHQNVVGVFTDYNEYSGMNCAALGGGKSRESLVTNPFRQPRAMPVYSMNLPQFSNGFIYVFNEQELDE